MGSRGRGGYGRGGGGRGRGGFRFAKSEPFVLFPEDVELPDINNVTEEKNLVYWNWKLQTYWKSSPYYLQEPVSTENQETDIERYSDRGKRKSPAKQDPLSYYMKLTSDYFPLELIHGSNQVQRDPRKVRWNPEAGLQKLDFLEKLEQKSQEHGKKGEKEQKDGENEEEEEGIEESEQEFSDDGDYNQNVDFDDDEDDFNIDVGDVDEGGIY
ncbi:hypothetical protein Scep_008166 [Stephania cephalantha]|uniref:DNA-directed RNA polymerase III subunit n=1 Tax=Stephania cephalantha TaxID=152367 RepID=A0AAP0PNW2_9MAGN